MNDQERDQGVEQIPECHAQQKLSTTENRYWGVKEIVFKIQDERIVKEHGFKGPHHDQGKEKQKDIITFLM